MIKPKNNGSIINIETITPTRVQKTHHTQKYVLIKIVCFIQ